MRKKVHIQKIISVVLVTVFVFALTPINTAASLYINENTTSILDPFDIPGNMQISQLSERGHIYRLKALETDLSTAVFENSDGTRSVYYFTSPIKYIDSDGFVRDKRKTLTTTNDTFDMLDNDVQLSLPRNINEGISLNFNAHSISIAPVQSNPSTLSNISSSATLTNNEVVYNNLFGSSNTKITPTLSGFLHETIVNNDNITAISYTLTTNQLTPTQTSTGTIDLIDTEGKVIFNIGTAIITDAIGNASIGTLSMSTVENKANTYTVTMSADENFLNDENTVFPIRFSSSATASYTTELGINTKNYHHVSYAGTSEYILLGNWGTTDEPVYSCNIMEMPCISDNPLFELLNDASVLSAELNLYCYIYSALSFMHTTFNEFDGFSNNIPTYNNITTNSSTLPVAAPMSSIGEYNSIDITYFAQYWNNNCFDESKALVITSSTASGYKKAYGSPYCTIAERRPYVILTYAKNAFPTAEHPNIPSNTKFTIENAHSGTAIELPNSTSEDKNLYNLVYYGAGNPVLDIPAGLYVIKASDNSILSVNSNKTVQHKQFVAGPGPSSSELWYIAQRSDGTFSFVSFRYPECSLTINPDSGQLTIGNTWASVAKWHVTPQRIWYSQTIGTIENNWNTAGLDEVYFSSNLNLCVMNNETNGGDLMDQGCAISSVAMVLRNMGATTIGVDIRDNNPKLKRLHADPFTVMMANCRSDGTSYTNNSEGNIILPNNNMNPNEGKPYMVHWSAIANAFGTSYTTRSYSEETLQSLLIANPEGVVVQFKTTQSEHVVVFLEYDPAEDDYIICDPGTSDTSKAKNVYFKNSYSSDRNFDTIVKLVTFDFISTNRAQQKNEAHYSFFLNMTIQEALL